MTPLQPSADNPSRGVVDERQAAEAWLVGTARKAGPHGVTADQESMMRVGYEAGYRAALQAAALPAVPEVADAPTGTVADIADAELLRRAVRHLAPRSRRQPAWARIMDVFGLGSTYSHQLCRRFGLDPDNGKPIKLAATPAHDQPEGEG